MWAIPLVFFIPIGVSAVLARHRVKQREVEGCRMVASVQKLA